MATGVNGQETGFAHRHLPLPTDNEKQSMHLDQYPWQQRCASATRHTAKQGFRITTLTNAQATASHIRRALKRLCQQAAKGDMVVIHFSGHGQPFEDPYPFAVFLSLFSLLYHIYVFFRTRLPISSLKNMYFSEVIYQRL